MLDLKTISLSDVVGYFPMLVPALQSAVVKLVSRGSTVFAGLKAWAKIALLFVVGLAAYLLLGFALTTALVLAMIGTGVAAVIYYFGRKPNAPVP